MYFAFIFAAINTLTVTYFLAIDNYPILTQIFPTFIHYIVIVVSVGIPLLVGIGYAHFKRTKAFRSETAIQAETSPFARRNLVNTDMTLKLNLEMIQMLIKLSNNEKINDEELKKITEMKNVLKTFVDDRTFENNKDLDYLNKITKD